MMELERDTYELILDDNQQTDLTEQDLINRIQDGENIIVVDEDGTRNSVQVNLSLIPVGN